MSDATTETKKGTVYDRVKKLLVEQLGREVEDKIAPEATFVDDLGADSLDLVEIIMDLEKEFEVDVPAGTTLEIPDEDAEKIQTVEDAVNYLKEKFGIQDDV